MKSVIAIVWTYNPDVETLSKCISSINMYVNRVFLIDNGSEKRLEIHKICSSFPNVEYIAIGFNSGVHALNVGIRLALQLDCDWILLLDDDTIIKPEAIKKVLEAYEKTCKTCTRVSLCDRIATIRIIGHVPKKLQRFKGSLVLLSHDLGTFSGTLIRADILRENNIVIREGFFLDQADFDFFNKLRKLDT